MNGTRSLLQWFPNSSHFSSALGSRITQSFISIVQRVTAIFCAEVMQANLKKKTKKYIYYHYFISKMKNYNNFFMCTYRSQKNFFFLSLVICDLTRRDRFFIHVKWPTPLSCGSCMYSTYVDVFLLLVTGEP